MAIPIVAAPNPSTAVAVDTFGPDGETSNEQQVAALASGEDGNNKEPVLSELALVDILRRWKNNNGDLPAFVHKLDPYAYPPWEAVQGRKHARRATKHVGGEKTWFIVSVDGIRRGRKVGEAGTWHVEDGGKAILGADGSSVVANKKRFSYKKSRPEKGGKQESTGWIMMQYSLEKDKEGDLISMVYKSSHKYAAKTLTAASSHAGAEEGIASVDAPMPAVSIRQTSKPRPRTRAAQKGKAVAEDSQDGLDAARLSLTRGITIDLLLQAAGKAVHCVDFKNACQIPEFVDAKNIYLTFIREVGLDTSIVSDSFSQLDLHIQHVAMTKELGPTRRDHLVCLDECMSTTILSEYLNELSKRARQGMMVIRDGEAKHFAELQSALAAAEKCPIPVRSFTLEEAEGHLMSDDYPVPGDKAAEDYTEMYANMLRDEITPIGGGGGARAHDGRFLVDVLEDNLEAARAFGYPNFFSAVNNGAGDSTASAPPGAFCHYDFSAKNGAGVSTGLVHDRSMDIDEPDGYDWDGLLNLLPAENLYFKALEDMGLDFDMINI